MRFSTLANDFFGTLRAIPAYHSASGAVSAVVLCMAAHQLKVLKSIVLWIFVDVMDDFVVGQ